MSDAEAKNEKSKVFVVTGPSGVGKGTLIARLRELHPQLGLSISATTRQPRPGEQDGVDYYFLTTDEFDRRVNAGDFVEHAAYSGNQYGTLRSELERHNAAGGVVLEIELQGARQIRESMPAAHQIFIAPPTPEELRDRLMLRGTDSQADITSRLQVATDELAAIGEFNTVVVNDQLEVAVQELNQIVTKLLA
ncbi:MAG: guanylate kinase [Thermoleophilaceae bacterium]|nr:guanylate kinase [Thermoleophilaceae bacterium]